MSGRQNKRPRHRALAEKASKKISHDWSPYKFMWTLVMCDLPTGTKMNIRNYSRFRKSLLKLGFAKMQFSIYYRCVPSDEKADALGKAIKKFLPPEGEVRILCVTSKQFQSMEVFFGKKPTNPEKEPQQLELF